MQFSTSYVNVDNSASAKALIVETNESAWVKRRTKGCAISPTFITCPKM